MSTDADLNKRDSLIQKKEKYFARLTALHDAGKKYQDLLANRQPAEIELQNFISRYERLENDYSAFDKISDQLAELNLKLKPTDRVNVEQSAYAYENIYFSIQTMARMWNVRGSADTTPPPATAQIPTVPPTSQIRLPRIQIPIFDGSDIKKWPNFYELFISLIDSNESLSKVEKLTHLRTLLKSHALALIETLPITARNYDIALQTLISRFQNNRLLASNYIDRIFAFKPLQEETLQGLTQFLDVFNTNMNALKSIDIEDLFDFTMLCTALKVLPKSVRKDFENEFASNTVPKFNDLIKSVHQHVHILELSQEKPTVKYTKVFDKSPKFSGHHSRSALMSVTNSKYSLCPMCKSTTHKLYSCTKFKEMNVTNRREFVKKNSLCFGCLGFHFKKHCKSTGKCNHCASTNHHSLLHLNDTSHDQVEAPSTSTSHVISQALSCSTDQNRLSRKILLSTAIIGIRDSSGTIRPVRAIIDNGSQTSLITEACAQKLKLFRQNTHLGLMAIANATVANSHGMVSCSISPLNNKNKIFTANALVLSKIALPQPNFNVNPLIRRQFDNLKLADPAFDKRSNIDFLIGADLYIDILNESYNVIKGQPGAISTVFGWIIGGPVPDINSEQFETTTTSTTLLTCCQSLDDSLKKFWEVEEIKIPAPLDPNDIYCENQFVNTHTRTKEGRYRVMLPFKENNVSLPDTRTYAKKCLINLETRLKRQPGIYNEYRRFMNEYIKSGHMSVAEKSALYILPHHCVLKETSSTTKLRPVFNASFKGFPSTISLNDMLLSGPKLQKDICDIIINFRLHAFIVCCDLQQMYRQVLIAEKDRHFQHIYYRPSENSEIIEYELNTLTFGVKPSAFLAQRVLLQLVYDEGQPYPLASDAIRYHTFVDDICTSIDSEQQALQLQQELIALFKLGGFTLRKWASNSQKVLDKVPHEHREHALVLCPDENRSVKVLGLQYDPAEDNFSYQIHLNAIVYTKRGLLSDVARIYDPLGWLSPFTFKAKCLIQQTWLAGIGWDDPLPLNIAKQWEILYGSLNALKQLKITRYIPVTSANNVRLVGFADASSLGYSAVLYLRIESGEKIESYLLKAKSKVAPLKTISIPRLELCAALLLARLLLSIVNTCKNIDFDSIHLFSDSMTVLAWLRTPPHKLKTFVATRVVQILENTQPQWWSHVSTNQNPSDISCRGATADELLNLMLWWKGPSFLLCPLNEWSIHEKFVYPLKNVPELKPNEIQTLLVSQETSSLNDLMDRVSSLSKLQRIVAMIFRFCSNCQSRKYNSPKMLGPLTPAELKNSLEICVKHVQNFCFHDDITKMSQGKFCSPNLLSLTPFIDPNGFLRVGGRLKNSMLPYASKHPLLLPKNSRLTLLICDYYHKITLHSGPRLTQALIQRKYWVIGIRNLIRQRIRNCIICNRLNAPSITPMMADLPAVRFEGIPFAFMNIGLDYAGPFTIKESSRRKSPHSKGYLAVFVCLSTKAIHLEFVTSLSTVAFLAALDRFVARRGLCRQIYSDCGTNFKGASRHLIEVKRFLQESENEISNYLAQREIKWNFNPPSAPHFGGIFEAGVKSAKHHLSRILGPLVLTYEEMCTILAKIESVLNSRPLEFVSSDPNDGTDYLTPGHFLIGRPLLAPLEIDKTDVPINTLQRYEILQRAVQCFWKRWSHDYLYTLMKRNKWTHPQENLEKGKLVYIKSENTAPLNWPIGRIQEVHAGKDGIIRVVSVKTATGTCVRPVHKLVPLPKVESA